MKDASENQLIENVGNSTWKYINKYWWVFWGVGLVLLVVAFCLSYYGYLDGQVFFVPLMWFIGAYHYMRYKVLQDFMKQFAHANGLAYLEYAVSDDIHGTLFKKGHSGHTSNVATGFLGGYETKFFHYQYNVGSGKHKKTYRFTVCELEFKGEVPDLTIEDKNFFDMTSFRVPGQKSLLTESEFAKHFVTYVPEHLNIEALEILTPEVMSYLIDNANGYDFQFTNNRLYVMIPKIITKRTEMLKLFDLATYVVKNLAPRLERLHDDIHALNEREKQLA